MPRRKNAWSRGWGAGYRNGMSDGHHYGVCQSIVHKTAEPSGILYDMRVVYIEERQYGVNDGVINALRGLVKELTVLHPLDSSIVEKVSDIQPDLVLVLNGVHGFPVHMTHAIRAKGIPTAVWFIDDPYYTDKTAGIAPLFDYVFTYELSCVPFYQGLGCKHVYYLPLAMSRHQMHPRPVPPQFRKDICFIGTGFWNRIAFFDRVAPYLAKKNTFLAGMLWNRLRNYRRLSGKIHLGNIPPDDTVKYYAGAKIVINLHRGPIDPRHNMNSRRISALSVNPRTFEMSACGALQITDIRSDLPNFYTPGHDIETYSSPAELINKIEYYLRHEDKRQEVAARGLRRTMTEHTYRSRLIDLLNTVEKYPSKRSDEHRVKADAKKMMESAHVIPEDVFQAETISARKIT